MFQRARLVDGSVDIFGCVFSPSSGKKLRDEGVLSLAAFICSWTGFVTSTMLSRFYSSGTIPTCGTNSGLNSAVSSTVCISPITYPVKKGLMYVIHVYRS